MALGPLLGFLGYYFMYNGDNSFEMSATFGIAILMAVWWITEAVPIYVTSWLPLIAFPLLGIMSVGDVGPAYMPQIQFFFIGGFVLAYAIEKWNLHRRIALNIIVKIGNSPKKIMLGFMVAAYALSMWILNTATVMMLLPALMAVVHQLDKETKSGIAVPFLLGLAYSASIGGTASLIGTAPNLFLYEFYNDNYPHLEPITFGNWMMVGFPLSLIMVTAAYLFIVKRFNKRFKAVAGVDVDYCKNELEAMGKTTFEEKFIFVYFGITVVLWFTMKDITIAGLELKGWVNLFAHPSYIKESVVAMLSALGLFLVPSKSEKGHYLMDWITAKKMPIGVIFLFGGGYALASAISSTGLGDWMADMLMGLSDLPTWLLVLSLTLFMSFFTELTSNTASTVLILPVLLALCGNLDVHPLLVMMPVVLAASYAFMLPVATPPNTIVFGTNELKSKDMALTGVWLNLIAVVITVIMVFLLGSPVFNF